MIETGVERRTEVTAADQELVEETEYERVARWRAEELERAGYRAASAARIAGRFDIDLHLASDLLERGCSEELALRILI